MKQKVWLYRDRWTNYCPYAVLSRMIATFEIVPSAIICSGLSFRRIKKLLGLKEQLKPGEAIAGELEVKFNKVGK